MKPSMYIKCIVLVALLALGACEEMPALLDEDVVRDPRLIAGPYIIEGQEGEDEIAYLRTNIAVIPGVKVIGGQDKIVRRYGRSNKEHQINLTPLINKNLPLQKFMLLLDDTGSAMISLQNPTLQSVTTIGFLGGGKGRKDLLREAASKLLSFSPAATVLTGGAFPLDEKVSTWDRDFFAPIQPLTPSSPLLMLPEDRALLPVEAGRGKNESFWSRDIGLVHLSFLSMQTLKNPSERAVTLSWLQNDLEANAGKWRVLVLSEPLFAAQRIYARAIETLGTILESGGVDLVVSGGGNYYQRTLPIQASGSKPVRYIVTGGLSTGKSLPVGREYRAAMANQPHVAVLSATADTLEWKAVSLVDSQIVDRVTVLKDGSSISGEPAIEKMDILTDALSALSLQREVVTIATQAAKAVDRPDKAQDISFVLANASPENIKGEMIWEVPYDSAYDVEPAAVQFGLESGFEAKAKFRIKPLANGANASLPVLNVKIGGVGSASQPLILSKRKYATLGRFDPQETIVLDGQMNEEGWKGMTLLKDFTVLATGAEPKQPLEVRVGYDRKGIYILARAAAEKPEEILTQAKSHDDPVHKDESIEIFIDPKNNGRDYFQFAVNTQGVMLDRSSMTGLAWNPQWQAELSRVSSYYAAEIFIPYQALGVNGMPAVGTKWGLNVCRNDYQDSAVREDPFKAADVTEVLAGKTRISRMNIGALAEEELGESAAPQEPEKKAGPGFEVVQWADTYGDNSRSGLYGQVTFGE